VSTISKSTASTSTKSASWAWWSIIRTVARRDSGCTSNLPTTRGFKR
jgi:hypothetical protein